MAEGAIVVRCATGPGHTGVWDASANLRAFRVAFTLGGAARAGAVVTLTQCQAVSPAYGTTIDAPPAVARPRTPAPDAALVVEAVVYVRCPGGSITSMCRDPYARVHVLVQASPPHDCAACATPCAMETLATGLVSLGALFASPANAPVVVIAGDSAAPSGGGGGSNNVTLCADIHRPLELPVQFDTDASMRALLARARVRIDSLGDPMPTEVHARESARAFGVACACAGYAHPMDRSVARPPGDPHAPPARVSDATWNTARDDYADWADDTRARPDALRFPRDLTGARRVAAGLARTLLRLSTPRPLSAPEADALRHWVRACAESWVTGISGARADACVACATAPGSGPGATGYDPDCCAHRVPWTAVANGPGGEYVRSHPRAAHVRHVRTLWARTPAAPHFDLVDAVDPRTGDRPVLIAVPREATTDSDLLCAFLFAPGVWRWPVPFDPAPFLRKQGACTRDTDADADPMALDVWTLERVRALRPRHPGAAAEFARTIDRIVQVAMRTQHPQFPDIDAHEAPPWPVHEWTVNMLAQGVYSDVIKRRCV